MTRVGGGGDKIKSTNINKLTSSSMPICSVSQLFCPLVSDVLNSRIPVSKTSLTGLFRSFTMTEDPVAPITAVVVVVVIVVTDVAHET